MENIDPAEHLCNYFSQLFVTLPVLDIRKSFDCVLQEVFVGKLSLEFNFCIDAYTSFKVISVTESNPCKLKVTRQIFKSSPHNNNFPNL